MKTIRTLLIGSAFALVGIAVTFVGFSFVHEASGHGIKPQTAMCASFRSTRICIGEVDYGSKK